MTEAFTVGFGRLLLLGFFYQSSLDVASWIGDNKQSNTGAFPTHCNM